MKAAVDEILTRFASRLGCEYLNDDSNYTPVGHASALSSFLSSASDVDRSCSIPCLSLRRRNVLRNSQEIEDVSVLLARPAGYCKRTIALAPTTLLRNLLCSFGYLLDVKLRRSIYTVMERYYVKRRNETADQTNTRRAVISAFTALCSTTEGPISPVSACTTFFVTSCPKTEHYAEAVDGECTREAFDKTTASVQLESTIDVRIPGNKSVRVIIRAPGSIAGRFKSQRNRPDFLELLIDTQTLYLSMKKECQEVVRRVVSTVVGLDVYKKIHEKKHLQKGTPRLKNKKIVSQRKPPIDKEDVAHSCSSISGSSGSSQSLKTADSANDLTRSLKRHNCVTNLSPFTQ